MTASGGRALILGGGLAGMATAMGLARVGVSSVIVDRDPEVPPESPEDLYRDWQRKPVPHFRHSHIFLARLRNILVAEAPNLLAELKASGAVDLDPLEFASDEVRAHGAMPGDEALVAIGARRSLFEWVFQRHVTQIPTVDIIRGHRCEGFEVEEVDGIQTVRAVHTTGGTFEVEGLVVDAMGRVSPFRRLIGMTDGSSSGGSPVSIAYFTLAYRSSERLRRPSPGWLDLGWARCSLFPGDSGYFTVTLVLPDGHRQTSRLRSVEGFQEVIQSVPAVKEQLDALGGNPVHGSSVQAMTGLRSRQLAGAPGTLANVVHVGDAAYAPNPIYGQGATMAFMQASLLSQAVTSRSDMRSAIRHYRALVLEAVAPYFRHALASDRRLSFEQGDPGLKTKTVRARVALRVRDAVHRDPLVFRAYMRDLHMIERPMKAFLKPHVILRSILVGQRRVGRGGTTTDERLDHGE